MKRYKRIVVLLIVLAVACGATFAVSRYQEHQEQIETSGEVVLEIPADSVTALSWDCDGEDYAFHKEDSWLYDSDSAFPVDQDTIEDMLSPFAEFGVSFVIENVEDYGQYGLDDPACTIHLTAGEQNYTIKLGDFSQMDEQRYVDIGDGNVYLAASDPMDKFDVSLSDLIQNDEIPAISEATRIEFSGSENYTITRQEDSGKSYSAEDVYFDQEDHPLDTTLVNSYLSALSGVDLSNYVTYNATEAQLQEYGMADPELTVTVDYSGTGDDGQQTSATLTVSIGRAPDDRATLETADSSAEEDSSASGSAGSDITAYLRVGQSPIVYQISGDDFTALMDASCDALRHQQIFWGDFDDVTQIDIALEGSDHTITSDGRGSERTYIYNGEDVDLTDFTTALDNLTARRFTTEPATGQEEIRLTLHLDNEDFPTVAIRVTRYDGEFCLVEVDGERCGSGQPFRRHGPGGSRTGDCTGAGRISTAGRFVLPAASRAKAAVRPSSGAKQRKRTARIGVSPLYRTYTGPCPDRRKSQNPSPAADMHRRQRHRQGNFAANCVRGA